MSNIFKNIQVADAVFVKRDLVFAKDDTKLLEGLKILKTANITSLPIFKDEEFLGIISMVDILAWISFGCFKYGETDYVITADIMKKFANTLLSDIMGFSNESASKWECCSTDSVYDQLELLYKGVHHILVHMDGLNGDIKQYRMLSQSDVLRIAVQNLGEIECETKYKTIYDLGLVQGKVFSIKDTQTALDGLRAIYYDNRKINAVAIVSPEGILEGTLSGSDLRQMVHSCFRELKALLLPVRQFLMRVYSNGFVGRHSCKPSDTLADVMTRLVTHRVHRLWIIDDDGLPIGVVTLSDICGVLWRSAHAYM